MDRLFLITVEDVAPEGESVQRRVNDWEKIVQITYLTAALSPGSIEILPDSMGRNPTAHSENGHTRAADTHGHFAEGELHRWPTSQWRRYSTASGKYRVKPQPTTARHTCYNDGCDRAGSPPRR